MHSNISMSLRKALRDRLLSQECRGRYIDELLAGLYYCPQRLRGANVHASGRAW